MKITRQKLYCLIALFLLVSLAGGFLYSERMNPLPADAVANYVGGQSCVSCHQQQASDFHGSHHDLAMDRATSETVLGKFDDSTIEHYGVTSKVFMDGDRYMVNTEGPDGEMQDFEVTMVFGYEPLQQYMVELKPPGQSDSLGQYQVLRISWDVVNETWFYLSPPDVDEKLEPRDPLHWTGISQRWNTNCAACHSTNLQKNFDAKTGQYSTTFTDIDVSCEACHGPGSLHVEIAERRRFFWDKNHGYGLAKLKTPSNDPQIESCAPCHSRRTELCSGFQAGDRFSDYFACQILSDQIYHDDGQVKEEDYVYGSFVQSKMYHKGIRCSDCHDPHSAKLKHDGNTVCTSCHQHPAGKYDTPAHHRHAVGSSGAMCVECHMPATTYMAIDSRRDHSFRVPRPDLSVDFKTPNACTACHLDAKVLPKEEQGKLKQYLDWMIEAENGNEVVAAELAKIDQQMAVAFDEWYPDATSKPERSKYYEQLVLAKSADKAADETAASLAVDNSAPAIFRASAIEQLLLRNVPLSDDALEKTLGDNDANVVATALSLLQQQMLGDIEQMQYSPDDSRLRYRLKNTVKRVAEFLDDDRRVVQISAGRAVAAVPASLRRLAGRAATGSDFYDALDAFRESLRVVEDVAANHMVLGGLYEGEQDFEKAELAYRTAIGIEPEFTGPRSNLAALLEYRIQSMTNQAIRGNNSQALSARIEALTVEAKRLRVEENQLLRTEVGRAEDLMGAHGLFYRYGLSCYLMGDLQTAEEYLRRAHQADSDSNVYALGLAAFYNQNKNFKAALPLVKQLIEAEPQHPGYKNLRDEVLAGLAGEQK